MTKLTEMTTDLEADKLPEMAVDDGLASAGKERVRRCLVTGERRPREELIRFVVGPDRKIVPDLAEKLPGRGMWLSADAETIKTAVSRKAFARAARGQVVAEEDLVDLIANLLGKRCIELLSLARRAGEAVTGFEKTRAWVGQDAMAIILHASDGAEGGGDKVKALMRDGHDLITLFSAQELGEAFGRDTAVHAAVARKGLGRRFLAETRRLAGFRLV